ncbi:hypothetical protein C1646_664344 [Rhizophagus diaphanus]|nr:hypothetical protein C1646_664344 [Rhizophagus diaphanus] [Rhizophagus sp. MUCL 43196]
MRESEHFIWCILKKGNNYHHMIITAPFGDFWTVFLIDYFSSLVLRTWLFGISTLPRFQLLICESLTEDSTHRSQFFSILAFRFEGPDSLAFWLFGSKVLVLSSTTSALWHSVSHFGSKVPVLSSATSSLWHFGFIYRNSVPEKFHQEL